MSSGVHLNKLHGAQNYPINRRQVNSDGEGLKSCTLTITHAQTHIFTFMCIPIPMECK